MKTTNRWYVEICTVNVPKRITKWNKIGAGLKWEDACKLRRDNRPFLTRATMDAQR